MSVYRVLALVLCVLLLPFGVVAEEAPVVLYPQEGERPALGEAGQLEVHFINVASADCMLLRMDGMTLMIDAGHLGTADRVLTYLDTLGVTSLDYAFLTHYHNDHIGGYLEIMDKVPIGEVLVPAGFEDFSSRLYDELVALMEEKALPVRTLRDGETMTLGSAELSFFQWQNEKAQMNDRSMVLLARLGERAALFTGDIENNGQKGLAEAYGAALGADILKMPHHGLAAYMSELHDAVQPTLATFSNTKSNIRDVINMTEKRGVDWILTTKGTVVAVTDGDAWQVWQIPRE